MIKRIALLMVFGLALSQQRTGDPSSSKFPGGYIGVGIQIGKTEESLRFIDVQISTGIALIGNQLDLPIYVFLGGSTGKRFQGGQSQTYFDWQAVMLSFVQFGIGRGNITINSHKVPRKKYWAGLSVIPLMYTTDSYTYDDKLHKQQGLMVTIPLPIFGFNFYP
tara:strand:+ start:5382 stop:5873 length:492 start_codon:yes stop_codon:yes gene_type:complete